MLQRITELLSGVDPNAFDSHGEIYWLKSSDTKLLSSTGSDAYVFAPMTEDRVDALLLGSIGSEGDEAVFGNGLIVETCSLSSLPYMDIIGPTYVTFETESDEKALCKIMREFGTTGKIPAWLTNPAAVCEMAGFAPDLFKIDRKVIDSNGIRSWRVPSAVVSIQQQCPALARYFVGAVLMSRLLGDQSAVCVFDLPASMMHDRHFDLLLARKDGGYFCMSVENGKVFALGYDMYRAVLSKLDAERVAELPGAELSEVVRDKAVNALRARVAR